MGRGVAGRGGERQQGAGLLSEKGRSSGLQGVAREAGAVAP